LSTNQASEFEAILRQQIYKILQEEKLLQGEWHLGKVDAVVSRYLLKAFIDGSQISYAIPCNPNIIFKTGDEIWVHFVNGDSKNKFASYKRATGTESIEDVAEGTILGDMQKSVYDKNNNGIVDKAENVDWSGVLNKPSTFTPSAHSHTLDQITETANKKIMTNDERTKLNTLEGDKTFEYTQITPLSVWDIDHNLNKYPSVTVLDSGGSTVVGDTSFPTKNKAILTFSAPFSGKAFFN